MRRAVQRWSLGLVVAGIVIAILAEPRAQPASGEGALVVAAEQSLGNAMRSGDKSVARRVLSLQFGFIDENGKIHERKDFLVDLKSFAAAPPSDSKVMIYGRIAMVTGRRKSAAGSDVFFLDVWAKQKGAWRAMVQQDVVVATSPTVPTGPPAARGETKPYECKNPCQTIPYRVRSPAEQDIVSAFQAIEKAIVAHDADEWSKHIADEFALYSSGRAPLLKPDRITTIKRQRDSNTVVTVGEIETMRLSVYDDGAAMIASHVLSDGSRPPYRAARVWVKRGGQWQLVISVQTEVK